MAKYVAALDQGTTSTRCMIFDHDGSVVVGRPEGARADLSRSRAGSSTTPTEIWAAHAGGRSTSALEQGRRRAPTTSPRSASPTSARPRWCGTATPASRSTTRSSGRTRAPTRSVDELSARRRPGPLPREGRPAARDLLLGPEGPLDPRQRRRRARAGRGRRPGCSATWTPGCIWNLTGGTDGGAARHRRDERQPHDADGPRDARLGRRASLGIIGVPRRCCPRSAPRARSTARSRPARSPASRSPATSATSRRPRSARPASSPARPRTPTAPATSCCSTRARRRCSPRTACSRRSATRSATTTPIYCLEGSIAITGALVQWLRDNLELITAAPEIEDAGQDGRGQRRRATSCRRSRACSRRTGSRDARGVIVGLTRYVNKPATSPARRWRRRPSRPARSSRR